VRVCETPPARALLRMRTASHFSPAHDVKQPISFPRRMFAPGVCNFASLTPNEGWAERRSATQTSHVASGCLRLLQRLNFFLLRPPSRRLYRPQGPHLELG